MTESELEDHFLLDVYPAEVMQKVGHLVLLYGQTDRLMIKGIHDRANPQPDIREVIRLVRGHRNGRGVTFGDWNSVLDDAVKKFNLPSDWVQEVKDHIKKMQPMRDQLSHDTLMEDKSGHLVWRTNQSSRQERMHKDFDMNELDSALSDALEFRKLFI